MKQLALFDYDSLDTTTRTIVQQQTAYIRRMMRRTAQDIVDIGQKLIEIKELLGHGNFEAWLAAEFDWTDRTARNFMRVAMQFKTETVSDLDIAPKALYLLAAPSTPEPARVEALDRAARGERVSHKVAKTIVEAHKTVVIDDEPETPLPVESFPISPSVAPARDITPLMTSNSHEWYTPPHIIERVKQVMGGIDLDPCSSAKANQVVGAEFYLSLDDDGLRQRWVAETVYMNPPYGDEISAWVQKLVVDYRAGYIAEAIALLPARTDTLWFKRLREFPRCFLWGRLTFGGPGNNGNSAPFPSVVVALGCNVGDFFDAFSDIGDVYTWMGEADYDA